MALTNLAKARAYHTAVSNYDTATIEQMVREDYIQHNIVVPTGRAPFVAMLPRLKQHHTKIENLRIFCDGSHVIMHHLWKNAVPFGAQEKVAFHIIRFDDGGLIAEHWCVMADPAPLNPSGRSQIDGHNKIEDSADGEHNRKKVIELFDRLIAAKTFADEFEKIANAFFIPTYRQHHKDIADGIDGMSAALRNGKLNIRYDKQHKVFASGDFALSISEGIENGKPTAFYDLFRFENKMIAEHWSVYQQIPTENLANDNTMFHF